MGKDQTNLDQMKFFIQALQLENSDQKVVFCKSEEEAYAFFTNNKEASERTQVIIDCDFANSIDFSLKIREHLLGLGIPTFKHPKICGTVDQFDK